MAETYTLDEFFTGAWGDRPEYSRDCPSWSHISSVHEAEKGLVEVGKCGATDVWFFLHMPTELHFSFYLYHVNAWSMNGENLHAEPFMWVCGTVFDGVRESSGGQHFSTDLTEMSASLDWLHKYACGRWPRFAKWYERPSNG